MPGTLHVIPYAEADAARNMALDEFFLLKPAGIYLRLYGWAPPAVSIGFGQRAGREIELEKLRRDGISMVRRITGGRAILHDREVTYSVAGEIGGPFGPTLHTAFAGIGQALRRSLHHLGVACDLEKGTPRDPRPRDRAAPPCFASTARSEIVVQGKKLIGSAQKRLRRRFLQHGTLPLSRGRDLVEYLRLSPGDRAHYREEMAVHSCALADYLDPLPVSGEIEKAFGAGFSESLELKVSLYSPAENERAEIGRLAGKYRSSEWSGGERQPAHGTR